MLPQGSKCGEAAKSKLPQAIAGNTEVWI